MGKVSVDHASQQLPHFHKTFHGMADEHAELDFIKEAQKLQEYGVHFYKVQRQPVHTGPGKVRGVALQHCNSRLRIASLL